MTAFTVVLSPEPEGGYSVSCPAMPGAVSEGDTRDEALRNIVEAMTGWWEVAIEEGFGPREGSVALIGEEIAFVLGWKAEEGYELLIETATVQVDTPAIVAA
jgi:predicted RNase H-like HicB family nuclease